MNTEGNGTLLEAMRVDAGMDCEDTEIKHACEQLKGKFDAGPREQCPWCKQEFSATPNLLGEKPEYCPDCRGRVRLCSRCKNRFLGHYTDTYCDKCETDILVRDFMRDVPTLYASSSVEKLPCPEAYHEIADDEEDMHWSTGLYLFGPSGTGKTRTMYLLCERYIKLGMCSTAKVIRGSEFAKAIPDLACGEPGSLSKYLKELGKVDILGIDEVDKVKLSERVESELFDLIERRLADQNHTILTSNMTADKFAARFSEQYRDAVKRRIFELYTPVRFKKGKA